MPWTDGQTDRQHGRRLWPSQPETDKSMVGALERGTRAHGVEVTAFPFISVGRGVASQHKSVPGPILDWRQGSGTEETYSRQHVL